MTTPQQPSSGNVRIEVPTGNLKMTGHAPMVTSAYTAAAAMADSPVAAAAYIEAEATMRAAGVAHLIVLAADKEGRHGLLRQLGFEGLQPDMVSALAGHELERRKLVKDTRVKVAIAVIAGLVGIVIALLR